MMMMEKAEFPASVAGAAQGRGGSVEVQPRNLLDPLATIRPEHLQRHEGIMRGCHHVRQLTARTSNDVHDSGTEPTPRGMGCVPLTD